MNETETTPQTPARKKLQLILSIASLMMRNVGLIVLSGFFFSKANHLTFETVLLALAPLVWMKNPMKYCGCGGSGGCRGCQEKVTRAVTP